MRKFYEVIMSLGEQPVSVVRCKSITQAAHICCDSDLEILNIRVVTPKNKVISGIKLKELWNA